jgi:hypothetical protein
MHVTKLVALRTCTHTCHQRRNFHVNMQGPALLYTSSTPGEDTVRMQQAVHKRASTTRFGPDMIGTPFHAVVTCPHAHALRSQLRKQVALAAETDLRNTGPDLLLVLLARYDQDLVSNFLMLIWRCWNVRNSVLQLQAGERISIAASLDPFSDPLH